MMRGAPPSKRTDSWRGSGPGRRERRTPARPGAPRTTSGSGSGSGPGSGSAGTSDRSAAKASFAALALPGETPPGVRALRRSSASVLVDSHRGRGRAGWWLAGGCARGRGRGRGSATSRNSRTLNGATKHDRLRVVGQLRHADPMSAGPSGAIVSSTSSTWTGPATAGVKAHSVFRFSGACGTGRGQSQGALEPAQSISTRSKLSCPSHNKHVRNHIASSDYEGVVTVGTWRRDSRWRNSRSTISAWTVDYCRTDPRLLPAGRTTAGENLEHRARGFGA